MHRAQSSEGCSVISFASLSGAQLRIRSGESVSLSISSADENRLKLALFGEFVDDPDRRVVGNELQSYDLEADHWLVVDASPLLADLVMRVEEGLSLKICQSSV